MGVSQITLYPFDTVALVQMLHRISNHLCPFLVYQTEADTIGLLVGWGIGHVVDGVAILELPDSAGVCLKAMRRDRSGRTSGLPVILPRVSAGYLSSEGITAESI